MFGFGKERNKLKRQELKEIVDEFLNDIKVYPIFEIPDECYLKCFDKLKSKLNKYELIEDKRFVTYGRLSFLKEELTNRLKDEELKKPNLNWENKWDNRMGAFVNICDYIKEGRYISLGQVPEGKNIKEVIIKNDEYYKEGYICKEEKNILLEMINEIEMFIKQKNLKEENSMELFGDTKKEYNIKEENNVSQKVYGIPNPDIRKYLNKNNISINKESIIFKIKKEDKNYVLTIYKKNEKEASITFCDVNKISEIGSSDNSVEIPVSYYNKLKKQIKEVILNWNNQYIGDKDCNWNLDINSKDSNIRIIGKGEYPINWNEFIELISRYELLYKKLLINNKHKVELLNRKDKSIEEIIKETLKNNSSNEEDEKSGNDVGENLNPDSSFEDSVEVDFDIDLLKKTIKAIEREDFCTTNVASEFEDGTPFTYKSSLSEELFVFYRYLYNNKFIDLKYLDNNELIKNKKIDELSFEEVMTKLTFIHRAERFCDGAIYSFVKSGDMQKCLKRLLNILEKES